MPLGEIAAPENRGTGTNFRQITEITSQSPFFLVRRRGVFNRASQLCVFLFVLEEASNRSGPSPFSARSAVGGLRKRRRLFVPEGFYGVEVRGADGRVEAEDDAYRHAYAEGEDKRPEGDDGGHSGEERYDLGGEDAYGDADEAADGREDDGLDEELADYLRAAGAYGSADADLAGAFGDGGEHDVHDADAAH